MGRVGIVIINFNSMNYLRITLNSVLRVKTDIPFSIGVIDNGSCAEERDACERHIKELKNQYPESEIVFYDAGKNLGFSGGNNVVIEEFLKDASISHICLLNSDVVVSDYWLEYLLEKNCDVIGPVTNAAGNEQTIPIDYEVQADDDALLSVNEYAGKRHVCYRGYVTETDLVTFFATVFKREVIETIGLLDEQFYPGSYEDDDYCIRILKAGYKINIARDCFLHHFGSGSFAKLDMENRKNIGNVNRERFEKKWNCAWKDRTWKLVESCRQDVDFHLRKTQDEWSQKQIESSFEEIEKLVAEWGEAIKFFTTQAQQINAPVYEYSAKQLVMMLWAKVKRRAGRKRTELKKKTENTLHQKQNQKLEAEGISKIYELIEAAKTAGNHPICVFAPMYNKENEKDGYVQRIKAIDTTVLKDMCRIYLYDEGTDCAVMRFDFIDPLHGYIVFNSHKSSNLQEIMKLVKYCGLTYTHSILRFMEDRTSKALWKIFDDVDVKHFWDVHGTVPEEYAMSGSELGSRMANEIETVMAKSADVVIVVTEAMGKFLREKYPFLHGQTVVVPIFNQELLGAVKCEKSKLKDEVSVVYAGGTQPWQNIPLMQDIIAETYARYRYKIFVPDPEEFRRLWGNRTPDAEIVIDSKSPEELYKEYETCDFGFVLRDSDPVNYVACPTKIMEYLKYGIIPVLKSTEIGDFVELGMQYVPYTDLVNGITFSEEERRRMMEENYSLLDKLKEKYLSEIKELKSIVEKGNSIQAIIRNGEKPVIGIVVTTFDKGGLEQVVLNLYLGYRKQGYDAYLMCQEDVLGIMAQQIEEGHLYVFHNSLKEFISYLYEKNITVLHYHYNVFGCAEAKKRGVRTLYTMHNVYTWKSDREIREYSRVLKDMDRIIPVSNLVKNYYLARTNAKQDNVQVIYNGIDFDELATTKLPSFLERSALGLKESDVVLGFVASFYPVKYQIAMIGVMEELQKRCPNARLLFIGNSENGYYKEFLKEYEKSPAKDVMQVVPYFEHKYMGEFLRRVVDIFTLPTLQEGCSNAVLEAIFCDKPMVLTNVGNAMDVEYLESCEVVRPAYTDVVKTSNEEMIKISVIKDSANKRELVEAFCKVIGNLPHYKERAVLSREKKEQYGTDYMVKQYLDIVDALTQ